MTGSTLLGVLISRRLGLRTGIIAQAETRTLDLGDVTNVLRLTFVTTLVVELTIWAVLTARLHWGYGEPLPHALCNGPLHAISAFNNAGFSTYSDSASSSKWSVHTKTALLGSAALIVIGR